MISVKQKGDFSKTIKYLAKLEKTTRHSDLEKYGKAGVAALKSATPVDSGKTAESWYYKIERKKDTASIIFCNSNIQNGTPIAIILQYGHGTGTGGWVEGRDYINPAIQPVFDNLAKEAWREVTTL